MFVIRLMVFSFFFSWTEIKDYKYCCVYDKMKNCYLITLNGALIVYTVSMTSGWVEAVPHDLGVRLYAVPYIVGSGGFLANHLAIIRSKNFSANTKHLVSQKKFEFIDPRETAVIDYGFTNNSDGFVFYPVYGDKCFFFKPIYTKDIIVHTDDSYVVVEHFVFKDKTLTGRHRWDKDPEVSRVDAISDPVAMFPLPTRTIVDSGCETFSVSLLPITFGTVVFFGGFAWYRYQDNYRHLRVPDLDNPDYSDLVKKLESDYPKSFFEETVDPRFHGFFSPVIRSLIHRKVLTQNYFQGRVRFDWLDCGNEKYDCTLHHNDGEWQVDTRADVSTFPRGYNGNNQRVPLRLYSNYSAYSLYRKFVDQDFKVIQNSVAVESQFPHYIPTDFSVIGPSTKFFQVSKGDVDASSFIWLNPIFDY